MHTHTRVGQQRPSGWLRTQEHNSHPAQPHVCCRQALLSTTASYKSAVRGPLDVEGVDGQVGQHRSHQLASDVSRSHRVQPVRARYALQEQTALGRRVPMGSPPPPAGLQHHERQPLGTNPPPPREGRALKRSQLGHRWGHHLTRLPRSLVRGAEGVPKSQGLTRPSSITLTRKLRDPAGTGFGAGAHPSDMAPRTGLPCTSLLPTQSPCEGPQNKP